MSPRLRTLAVIAVLLLASVMLSIESTDRGAPPRNAAAPPEHKTVNIPPLPQIAPPEHPGPFTFENVQQLAKERAAHEYRAESQNLPAVLANLTYDQYREINFRSASALWHGQTLFEVQFFHRGYRVRQRVNVFEVTPAGAALVEYSPRLFTFGRLKPPKLSTSVGFAGFRVHFPLHTPAYKDELLVFLGASYFRVLGRNQHYGASARGLAIDTGAQSGEEFPTFTDFWLVHPQPADRGLIIYALLDSKSVTGAYQFEVRPGETTQVEVHCDLYPRRAIAKLGVAPLTSMFLYGEDATGGRHFDDYRPQVHDSDGLMNETGHGQWIWRPLANPRDLRVNRFMDENPRGFGLIQRDRNFAHYQDVESQYESRPSYWVQPLGSWGKGGVELVEIPSDEEIHDNMVAYWVPDQQVAAGKPLSFSYLLSAFAENPSWPPGGRVVAVRSGNPAVGDNKGHFGPGARRLVVDFAGGELDGLGATQPIKAELSAENGQIDAMTVQRVPESGAWRLAFVLTPRPKKPVVSLRCYLTLYGEVLTETWVHQWTP